MICLYVDEANDDDGEAWGEPRWCRCITIREMVASETSRGWGGRPALPSDHTTGITLTKIQRPRAPALLWLRSPTLLLMQPITPTNSSLIRLRVHHHHHQAPPAPILETLFFCCARNVLTDKNFFVGIMSTYFLTHNPVKRNPSSCIQYSIFK